MEALGSWGKEKERLPRPAEHLKPTEDGLESPAAQKPFHDVVCKSYKRGQPLPQIHALLAHGVQTRKTVPCSILTLHTQDRAARGLNQAAALPLYIVSITLPRAEPGFH